jgi:hypothetical protein
MDIGTIIREVEVARESDPELFPFDPEPARHPAPEREREPADPRGSAERAR